MIEVKVKSANEIYDAVNRRWNGEIGHTDIGQSPIKRISTHVITDRIPTLGTYTLKSLLHAAEERIHHKLPTVRVPDPGEVYFRTGITEPKVQKVSDLKVPEVDKIRDKLPPVMGVLADISTTTDYYGIPESLSLRWKGEEYLIGKDRDVEGQPLFLFSDGKLKTLEHFSECIDTYTKVLAAFIVSMLPNDTLNLEHILEIK